MQTFSTPCFAELAEYYVHARKKLILISSLEFRSTKIVEMEKNLTLRERVKRLPVIGGVAISLYLFAKNGLVKSIRHEPIHDLAAFSPHSAGSYAARNLQTIRTAASFLPALERLLSINFNFASPQSILEFSRSIQGADSTSHVSALTDLFISYGSDKATTHDYSEVYGRLFPETAGIVQVVEIGIGTKSKKVLSTMGSSHLGVGGSLRAWRDFFPNANVLGLDIDPKSLFEDNRIKTATCDQTDVGSLAGALSMLPNGSVDLIVDDGLHSLDANLNTIYASLPKIRKGGWMVVEDINEATLGAWKILTTLLRPHYQEVSLVKCRSAYMFLIQK
jgi:hypothetical protein